MTKMKKLFVFMLAFTMLFSAIVFPLAVYAEETTEKETEETAAEGEENGAAEEEATETEGEEGTEPEETLSPEEQAEKELAEIVEFEEIAEEGKYTNMQAWSVSPSNWNAHTYETSDDGDFLAYFASSLFTFQYDYESGEWTKGYSIIPAMVTELPADVTAEYAGDERYAVPVDATEGYAYRYVLRDDLKWQDGTPINADTFIYSVSQLLNPKMANHRASMMYASGMVMHNAEKYTKQGTTSPMNIRDYAKEMGYETVGELIAEHGDMPALVNWASSFGEMYADGEWVAEGFENDTVEANLPISDMKALFVEKALEWGQSEEEGNEYYETETYINYDYPEMDFSEVGFIKTGDLEFTLVLDSPLIGFDFYWYCSDFPLVYEPYYEAAKVETEDSDLITSTYNTTVDGTMSYGAYKLVGFQDDKYFELEKNENWFGWNVPELAERYPADTIYAQIVKAPATRYQMFLKGQLNSYNLQPDEVEDYRGSEFIMYTPRDFTGSLQIQSNKEALEKRQSPGINKTILTIKEFRKALTWAIDRADFAKTTTAASVAGFGLLNSRYIADPETMTPYRDYDPAKETLLNVYGVEYGEGKEYDDLEEAYAALTAYDLDGAKELFDIAYDKAIEEGLMKEDDKVSLTFSFGVDNENSQKTFNYLSDHWKAAVEGTKLEGKLEFEYDPTAGNNFAVNFKEGISDLLIAGWSGATMDPFFLISAYLDDNYRYAMAFDPDGFEIEHEVEGKTYSLTPMGWYKAMMGYDPDHPFGKGKVDEEVRIGILALIEAAILEDYSSSPLYYGTSASLFSQRIEYESPDLEFHPIMEFGNVYYLYDDIEWQDYISESDGFLDYH